MFWKKKVQIVTHNGSFHSDDVFAAAVLSLYFESSNTPYKITRSVDEQVIQNADIVFDIGGVYDPESNRFDHHQKGGAGDRENGIPYAAFGLIWKHYGLDLCDGDEEVWKQIDTSVVQPIDAGDNGVNIFESTHEEISPVLIQGLIGSFNISFDENPDLVDERFGEVVAVCVRYIERVIHQTQAQQQVKQAVKKAYKESQDKRFIVLDTEYGRMPITIAVSEFSEVLYFVYPSNRAGWSVCASRVKLEGFESKKPFPESWRGLRDDQIARASGVEGAVFCHNSGFLCAAKTREAAIELARKALKA